MPSPRRMRLLMLATVVTVVVLLFYTSGSHDASADKRSIQDFYQKTMEGMKGAGGGGSPGRPVIDTKTGQQAGHIPADKDGDGDVDDDDRRAGSEMHMRLKVAEQEAKDKANSKAPLKPDPPSHVVGKGSAADGQAPKDRAKAEVSPKKDETPEEHEAEMELNSILKKAPVVIFSKTYCPHSKRAKGILLDKYTIKPEAYVVELDEHRIGAALQAQLGERTGRRTVPNVLINGVSIGGGDEVAELDETNKLADKVVRLGNKRVEILKRFTS